MCFNRLIIWRQNTYWHLISIDVSLLMIAPKWTEKHNSAIQIYGWIYQFVNFRDYFDLCLKHIEVVTMLCIFAWCSMIMEECSAIFYELKLIAKRGSSCGWNRFSGGHKIAWLVSPRPFLRFWWSKTNLQFGTWLINNEYTAQSLEKWELEISIRKKKHQRFEHFFWWEYTCPHKQSSPH